MKKLIITGIMIFGAMPVFAIIPPDAAIIQVHDMQYIKDQNSDIRNIMILKKFRKKKIDITRRMSLHSL